MARWLDFILQLPKLWPDIMVAVLFTDVLCQALCSVRKWNVPIRNLHKNAYESLGRRLELRAIVTLFTWHSRIVHASLLDHDHWKNDIGPWSGTTTIDTPSPIWNIRDCDTLVHNMALAGKGNEKIWPQGSLRNVMIYIMVQLDFLISVKKKCH